MIDLKQKEMNSLNRERLKVWAMDFVDDSSKDTICELILELTEMLIQSEDVKFYDSSIAPYWDCNGEYIDGKDRDEN
jgi:hypothetical protein